MLFNLIYDLFIFCINLLKGDFPLFVKCIEFYKKKFVTYISINNDLIFEIEAPNAFLYKF